MTVPCPAVAIYEMQGSVSMDELFSGHLPGPWLARYVVPKRDPKTGAEWFDFLPMIFQGASREGVVATARKFWADEQAKIEAKRTRGAEMGAARRRTAA